MEGGSGAGGLEGVGLEQLEGFAGFEDGGLAVVVDGEEVAACVNDAAVELVAAAEVDLFGVEDFAVCDVDGAETQAAVDDVEDVVDENGGGVVALAGGLVFPEVFRFDFVAVDLVGLPKDPVAA